MSTINFVTFDDGMTYISISEIESFGYQREGNNEGTWIKLKDGTIKHSLWGVLHIAELLGPCVNLHH